MTKTLADYTPDERRKMIGMWCDHKDERYGEALAVLTNVVWEQGDDNRMKQVARLYWPREKHHSLSGETLETVTPCLDLPRAWDPDGTPPEWEQEALTTQPHPRGSWNSNPEHPEYFQVPPGTEMRRWVSEWKEA